MPTKHWTEIPALPFIPLPNGMRCIGCRVATGWQIVAAPQRGRMTGLSVKCSAISARPKNEDKK